MDAMTTPIEHPSSPRPPSRAILAYSGLVTWLAVGCLLTAFAPDGIAPHALGGVLIAAALLGLLIELVAESRATLALRLAWSGLAVVTGAVLVLSPMLIEVVPRLVLAAFLLVQAILLGVFAFRARQRHEIGAPALTTEGMASAALAVFVLVAYPFPQQWILGSVVAVGLLDYAGALGFREFDGR